MNTEYYVYLHRKASNNEVFYVGKGKGKRAFKNSRRSTLWNRVKNKYGLVIEIYKENLTETEALNLEMSLIKEYGRIDLGTGCLVNLTDGGDTTNLSDIARKKISDKAKNRVVSEAVRKQMSESRIGKFRSNPHIHLINRDGREVSGTFSELLEYFGREYYSRLRNITAGRTKSFDRWLIKNNDKSLLEDMERRSKSKDTLFTFISNTEIVTLSRAAFYLSYKIKTSPLFNGKGKRRVSKGWAVLRENESIEDVKLFLEKHNKPPEYLFVNEDTTESFFGSASQFSIYANIKKSSLCDLFRKNPKKVRGWFIKESNDRTNN